MGLISNGTTIFDNGAMASGFGGSMVFISSQTASASATIDFTTGIDSTYKEYVFYFVNIHPATDNTQFNVNFSTDGGSTYAVTKTTTNFRARHFEDGTSGTLDYLLNFDLAQSTAGQNLAVGIGNQNDESGSGTLTLFNPSSTTFVKHFIARVNEIANNEQSRDVFVAGYCNTTSAINAVQFSMSSGNFDGKILLFGIN